jgi:hypothetical protein
MIRTISRFVFLFGLLLSTGCAMCNSEHDYTYGAYGGRWQRDDPVHGRVGSAFSPLGAMVVNEAVAAPEAEPADTSPPSVDAHVEQSVLR